MERPDSSQQTQRATELEKQNTSVLEQEVTAITPTDFHSDTKKPVSPRKRRLLPKVALGVLLGAGAIAAGIYAYRWSQNNQVFSQQPQTDNAYVTADIQPVTSRVSGIVTGVAVNDNQQVTPGTVLVKLDPRDYQVSLTQAKADLELAKQQAALARENTRAVSVNTPQNPSSANSKPSQAAIKNRILQTQSIDRQTELVQQQYKTAQSTVAQKQAEVKKAELQLSYSNITALVPGKVGNKSVSVGQRVQPGQTLLTVVQPNRWIIANFKETQLEKIQPGQKVSIRIAAFPNQKFRGKVDSMSPTSFGKVAILPQDNSTTNFTKTQDVQLIPVKIMFDPESIKGYAEKITPGMSAIAVVETEGTK